MNAVGGATPHPLQRRGSSVSPTGRNPKFWKSFVIPRVLSSQFHGSLVAMPIQRGSNWLATVAGGAGAAGALLDDDDDAGVEGGADTGCVLQPEASTTIAPSTDIANFIVAYAPADSLIGVSEGTVQAPLKNSLRGRYSRIR
jgi:hypothetical protein